MDHTHFLCLVLGHHSLFDFEATRVGRKTQFPPSVSTGNKDALEGSNDWMGNGLVRGVLEDFKHAQVIKRSLGGLRDFIPGACVEQ